MVELWEEQRRAAQESNIPRSRIRLYPVIPLVFYTGTDTWDTPLSLRELMDLPDGGEVERFVPQWETLFLNLQNTPADVLTRFSTALGYALRVLQAEKAPFAELERVLSEAFAGLEGLSDVQSGEWLRVAWYIVLMIYHRRHRVEYDALLSEILEQTRGSNFGVTREVETMVQSMAQYVAEQAEARGEARGIQATLFRIGRKRFGEENEQVRQRLEAITSREQLDRLVDRLDEVESWEALLETLS